MGAFAEDSARTYGLTRAAQDGYALESLARAQAAIEEGAFAGEIAAVPVIGRGGTVLVDRDEQPGKAPPDKIPGLRPAFAAAGTITAASSASISDGAAALVLAPLSVAAAEGLIPQARIAATAAHAHAPVPGTTAPVFAICCPGTV